MTSATHHRSKQSRSSLVLTTIGSETKARGHGRTDWMREVWTRTVVDRVVFSWNSVGNTWDVTGMNVPGHTKRMCSRLVALSSGVFTLVCFADYTI